MHSLYHYVHIVNTQQRHDPPEFPFGFPERLYITKKYILLIDLLCQRELCGLHKIRRGHLRRYRFQFQQGATSS
jgi:hypothetical protein